MGNMANVKDEILKIAEDQPHYIDAKGILLATFASVAEPSELEDYFISNGRSFFIFDLDKNSSGVNIDNKNLHNHLFGHVYNDVINLNDMSNRLINDIEESKNVTGATKTNRTHEKDKIKHKINSDKMTQSEKESLINKILDKGYSNLSEDDINMLNKITEKKIDE